ncbi:hypothetical protein D3C72_1820570 [compost metagenome]
MIVLSAGCASLAALMRDAGARGQTKRASATSDRRPCLIAIDQGDQRVVRILPGRQTR